MANMTSTDIDMGSLQIGECEHEDGVLTLAGADELLAGTILARHTGTGAFQLYVKGGSSNGNGTPKAVLPCALSAVGAGDYPVRPIVKGTVNKARLVIDADGDDSNIDAAVRDQLRGYGILPQDVKQLGGELRTDEDS